MDPLATGANRGCRFLAYNMLGFVSSGPGIDEDCASVEVMMLIGLCKCGGNDVVETVQL
jgi:hypothetical protein